MPRFPNLKPILLALAASLPMSGSTRADQAPPKKDAPPSKDTASNAPFTSSIRPLLAKYCLDCHGAAKPKGGVNLAAFQDDKAALKERKVWKRVKENVEGGLMPPEDHPQPSQDEVDRLVRWIDTELKNADCGKPVDPGRITLRRLNRAEYNNTVRDLVGVDFHPADDFPSDDVGYGFDNIGDVLTLPPILMEKYLAAAESIAEQAIVAGPNTRGPVRTWDAQSLDPSAGGEPHGEGARILASNGAITVHQKAPRDGTYVIRVRAFGHQAGPEPVRMAILVDGKSLATFEVRATEGASKTFEHREKLRAGDRRFSVAFLNDYYKPDEPDAGKRDRNLLVESIEIEGPLYLPGDPLPASHRKIIFRTPKNAEEFSECATAVLKPFATRAYRRPLSGGELAKLLRFVDLARENGDSFERGIQLAVEAALVSPQFLFRVELNRRAPDRGKSKKEPVSQPLNSFEIASRLSYFLWSSMPDDELLKLAEENKLLSDDILTKQVRRMLNDPRAQALVENFAGQWLQLRNLKTIVPDRGQFPSFDEALREAMQKETELFFASVMRDDRSILDFIDSDYTFLNGRLARHYGIKGVDGEQFRLVKLNGRQRGGLLGQASILTVTSNPTRTSPVKRGKWVLEQILGTPPPPPPPDVPELKEDKNTVLSGTLRQRMEQHRAVPSCANCHSRLDPPGFGLENYDAVGAWRDKEGAFPIDASGQLPSGELFRGPGELKAILKTRKRDFARCLAEKMLTYALGRGLEDYDACTVDTIVDNLASGQYKFSSLVLEIVKSEPFQKRRR